MDIHGGLFPDPTVEVLKATLDGTAMRQQILANDVANADTPGFVPKDLRFQAAVSRYLAKAREAGPTAPPPRAEDFAVTLQDAPNLATMDGAMSALAQNSLLYQVAAQVLTARYAALRSIFNDGRGGA